ncbi:MAG: hypothetical protein M3R44_03285 [Candidatus Eremiobacteraeota bacterium]|nr:hypothetical protein [Candidatus Eremiobacteraeota bacterium]
MSHFIITILHIGAWLFGLIFLFAVIGFFAVIRWILGAFRRTESAVEGGVHNVGDRLVRREPYVESSGESDTGPPAGPIIR